jgi:histidine kinase-, DNA gyrase B-, and HSP90-like ATPase
LKDFIEWIVQELDKVEEQVYGLSIVKEILDKNNGKIDISSELGKGTEVIIRFNIKEANLEGRNSRQTLRLKKSNKK